MKALKRAQFSQAHQEALFKAHQLDHTYFDGDPCVSCGNTLRYAASQKCVTCKRAAARKISDKRSAQSGYMTPMQARAAGLERYEGIPHAACGTTLRYARCGSCVACTNNAKRNNARRSQKYQEGKECGKCGTTLKFVTGACVHCMREAAKNRKPKEIDIPRENDKLQSLLSRMW